VRFVLISSRYLRFVSSCVFLSSSSPSSFRVLVGLDPIFVFLFLIPVVRQVNIVKVDGSG